MTAEISMIQFWSNPSLWGFFLTKQAQDELEDLVSESIHHLEMLDAMERRFPDLDDLAECLHSESHEWLKGEIGIEYFYEEEEEEDEEEL